MLSVLSENWKLLHALAVRQGGLFTPRQALRCGLSKQVLQYHLKRGRIERRVRSVYRLSEVPPLEEELFLPWLWAGAEGVFSHRTALEILGILPREGPEVHVSLPTASRRRACRPPATLVLHYEDVHRSERKIVRGLPVVCAERALVQCVRKGLSGRPLRLALANTAFRTLLSMHPLPEGGARGEPGPA